MTPFPPVSVLDVAPVTAGETAASALRDLISLARIADEGGCHRFWVAEHHNMPAIASCSPPVLVAAIAAATRRMRVGSGGVMLTNHAPLVVAEQFGTLEAVYPGRIDLGVGRAPGTTVATLDALRRPAVEAFPDDLRELLGFLRGVSGVRAVPADGGCPQMWLLGASSSSAFIAGTMGLSYAYAYHLKPAGAAEALREYRTAFRAAAHRHQPSTLVSVRVICGTDDDDARRLAAPAALAKVRGVPREAYLPSDAAAALLTPEQEARFAESRSVQAVGGPETVRRRLIELVEELRPDELMVTAPIPGLAERSGSLRRVLGLATQPRGEPAATSGLIATSG